MISLAILLLTVAFGLTVGASELRQGEALELNVHIDEYEGVSAGGIEIFLDPEVFELTGAEWTLSSAPMIKDFQQTNLQGVFLYSSAQTVGGDVFSLRLRVKDTAAFSRESQTISVKLRFKASSGEEIASVSQTLYEYTVACQHDFSAQSTEEIHVASPATCTEYASYYYSCSVCGENGTQTFVSDEILPHAYDDALDADCNRCGSLRTIASPERGTVVVGDEEGTPDLGEPTKRSFLVVGLTIAAGAVAVLLVLVFVLRKKRNR